MKKLFRPFCYAAALLCTWGIAGCNDDDPQTPFQTPEIAVKEVSATASSVTFTLAPTHAVRCTYAVAPKGTTATPVEVETTAPVTRTVDGLDADLEYTITAVAYAQDGTPSNPATHDFITSALAQIAIGKVTATYKSAAFTLTPLNATAYAYRCVGQPSPDAATRAEQEWIRIEGGEPSDIELTGLAAEHTYTIEAYASNADGDGRIVTKSFTTEPLPEPLTVQAAATSKTVWMKFTMCEDVTKGYYYYLHDSSWADDPVNSVETFLQDLRDNPDWYTLTTASKEELRTGCTSNTTYKLFTVSTDPDGYVVDGTAVETILKTKQFDALRTSHAGVAVDALTPGYITVDAKLTPSDDCAMALVDCVKKSDLSRVGTITAYVNMNLDNFTPVLRSSLGESYTVQALDPRTEYVLFTVGIDESGDYGLLDSEEFTTTEVTYRQDVKVDIEVLGTGFLDVTFDVTYDGCQSVRRLCITDLEFVERYESNESNVWKDLYSSTAELLPEGEVTIEYLEYDNSYTLFALPVTSDGELGVPVKKSFSTRKYTATGTAEVTVALEGIDRSGDWPVATFTITPGPGCQRFIHYAIEEEAYANNSARIGDYLFRLGYYETVDPAIETRVDVTLWGTDFYLLAAACDAQGNWSPIAVSEKLVYNPDGGGGGGGTDPVVDPDEVPADAISPTAATVTFISYLYDQSSWNPEWSDWDNSVYRAQITLEAGYTAWYYLVSPQSYDWVVGNEVGGGKTYATLALWIKEFGSQLTQSGPIAARGDYATDYMMLVLPETLDGKHSSDRVYKSEVYRWDDLTGEATDPGITGGGGIDPRARRR